MDPEPAISNKVEVSECDFVTNRIIHKPNEIIMNLALTLEQQIGVSNGGTLHVKKVKGRHFSLEVTVASWALY
jgi:hypothetical protein